MKGCTPSSPGSRQTRVASSGSAHQVVAVDMCPVLHVDDDGRAEVTGVLVDLSAAESCPLLHIAGGQAPRFLIPTTVVTALEPDLGWRCRGKQRPFPAVCV